MFERFKSAKGSGPAPRAASVPTGGSISPHRMLADGLSEIPADVADPSILEVKQGLVPIVVAAIYAAGYGAYTLAQARSAPVLAGARQARETAREPARGARRALKALRPELKGAVERRETASRLLSGRLRRTKITKRKAYLVTGGVLLGEIALNASAAIGLGDIPALSVIAFLGVGAATLGVAMLAGPLRRAIDQHHFATGEVPAGAKDAGLAHWFAPAKGLRSLGILCGAVLVLSALALGLAVGVLREESGTTALFGLFTAVTLVGAAAICFVAEDGVADLFESLDVAIAALLGQIATLEQTVGVFEGARAVYAEVRAGAEAEALGQWNTALELGWLGLPPHVVGHILPERFFVVTPEDYLSGHWRGIVLEETKDVVEEEDKQSGEKEKREDAADEEETTKPPEPTDIPTPHFDPIDLATKEKTPAESNGSSGDDGTGAG